MEEQIRNEQTETDTQAVNTESEKGASKVEVSLGKFKDTEALLNAYNSLQAEFTKRCQRIKELEGGMVDKTKPVPTAVQEQEEKKGITLEEKEEILKGYLKELLGSKSEAIVMDGQGGGLVSPKSKPKTISEAGNLARDFLNR